MYNSKPTVGARLASMILDHVIMCFVCIAPMTVFVILAGGFEDAEPGVGYNLAFGFVFFIYMAKDSFNGKSLAKRILKTQVVRYGTIEPASPLRCFLRNLFMPLWPLEVLVTLTSPSRRLGDRLAGTQVLTDAYIKHVRQQELVDLIGVEMEAQPA